MPVKNREPGDPIFLDHHYTYRTPWYWFFTVAFGCMGLFCLIGVIMSFPMFSVAEEHLLGLIAGSVLGSIFLALSCFLSWAVLLSPAGHVLIDAKGICFDGREYPWERISDLSAGRLSSFSKQVHIIFVCADDI